MRGLSWFVLLGVLAAGCGGSSNAARPLPPASSPSATPSPSPSQTLEEQVLAAVTAYYAEVDRAGTTGRITTLESLTLPTCDCRKLARGIATTYAAGTKIAGAVHTVLDPRVATLSLPAAVVTARLRVSAYELVMKDGSRKQEAADEFPIEVRLAVKDGRWLIIAVEDPS